MKNSRMSPTPRDPRRRHDQPRTGAPSAPTSDFPTCSIARVPAAEPVATSPVRVQVFHPAPGAYLRYVDQVVGEGSPEVTYQFGRVPINRTDAEVVHLPRLDALYGGEAPTGFTLFKTVLAFVRQLLRHRIALVRTLHGADRERARGRWDRLAMWILDRATAAFIVVDDAGPRPPARTTVIPLGHFRDRFTGLPRSEQVPGRLLFLAPIQLGAGVRAPLRAFPETTDPSLSLHVIGAAPPALAEQITELTTEHASITARLEHISMGAVICEMTAAEMVLLPGAERLEELTVLMSALSLDRPVLVPESPSARALAETYGADWVRVYSGPLTGALIDQAVQQLRANPPQHRPHLDDRDLATTGAEYAAVFVTAAKHRKR